MEPTPTTEPTTRRTRRFVVGALTAMFLTVTGATFADAAALGGVTSAVLSALSQPSTTGAPTVVAWENFNGTNGTNLNGTTTDGGARTWTAVRGTWTIQGNRADTNSADVALVINGGSWNRAVEATLFRGGTAFDIGLTANMNAAGTQFLSAELTSASNGSLEVWRYNGGWTLLASVTNLYSGPAAGWPTSTTMRLESTAAGQLRVFLDGTLRITHTLSAGDQTTYKNATHQLFGLYAYFDGNSRWDDFHLDA